METFLAIFILLDCAQVVILIGAYCLYRKIKGILNKPHGRELRSIFTMKSGDKTKKGGKK